MFFKFLIIDLIVLKYIYIFIFIIRVNNDIVGIVFYIMNRCIIIVLYFVKRL